MNCQLEEAFLLAVAPHWGAWIEIYFTFNIMDF